VADDYDEPGWLRDELRQRNREIAELKRDRDERDDLIRQLGECAYDYVPTLESWREAFDMELALLW